MEPTGDSCGINLSSLLISGKFSDLKLVCEDREFAVHKAILCAQSRVFSAACEGSFQESRSNIIEIEEFNDQHETPSVDSNDIGSGSAATKDKQNLCLHLNANSIGDYYDIQPLCMLSRSRLRGAVEADWSPDGFLQLLTEACTTRKTGDVEFHRLLGQIVAEHMEDLAPLWDLGALDVPAAVLTGVVVASTERIQSLRHNIWSHKGTIHSLERSTAALEMQVANAHSVHETLSRHKECRNINCTEMFPCYIEQDGSTYNLRCSKCRCRH